MPETPPRHTLLAPLDWGLGHASRSLALAGRLEAEGDRVSWACSGPAAEMLRRELPERKIHELPAYRVRYKSRSMVWNVMRQAWRWRKTIKAERKATAELVDELGIDRIVSDSRFGCHDPRVHSVFMTHQLHPVTHFAPASAAYKWQLQHFDEFWVPDEADHGRLSGKLSSSSGYENVQYIGQLSRLSSTPGHAPFDLLVLLSGPEPMRTRLEEIIVSQLASTDGITYRLVRGLPEQGEIPDIDPSIPKEYVLPFADTTTLSPLLTAAHCVIARSGYSTLMDLQALQKKAILIPTPGQTEQAYLAQRAQLQGWAVAVMEQEELDLVGSYSRIVG